MLDASQAQNLIRNVPYFRAWALHDDHLKTVVLIQVDVCSSQHVAVRMMLKLDSAHSEGGMESNPRLST
jgi:hypothetical protein